MMKRATKRMNYTQQVHPSFWTHCLQGPSYSSRNAVPALWMFVAESRWEWVCWTSSGVGRWEMYWGSSFSSAEWSEEVERDRTGPVLVGGDLIVFMVAVVGVLVRID